MKLTPNTINKIRDIIIDNFNLIMEDLDPVMRQHSYNCLAGELFALIRQEVPSKKLLETIILESEMIKLVKDYQPFLMKPMALQMRTAIKELHTFATEKHWQEDTPVKPTDKEYKEECNV